MPNMLPDNWQRLQPPQALPLDGMDCRLPSAEDQANKKQQALLRLKAYIALCGGELDEGWDCAVRCRITTRRSGRLGVTTDNYYYSPSGQTFRNHKQVAEFMGLSLPVHQDSQHIGSSKMTITSVTAVPSGPQGSQASQHPSETTVHHQIDCASDSCRKRPASLSASSQKQRPASKRMRTVAVAAGHHRHRQSTASAPLFDISFAAQAARSAAFQNAALAAQAALMGPNTLGSTVTAAPVSSAPEFSPQQQQQQDCQVPSAKEPAVPHVEGLMLPPTPQGPKRTKALLAAKYAVSTSSCCTPVRAATADADTISCGQQGPSSSAGLSTANSSSVSSTEQQPAVPAQQLVQCHNMTHPRQLHIARLPSACTASSSSFSTAALSTAVGISTDCTSSSPSRQTLPPQQQHQLLKTKELKPRYLQQQQKQMKSHSARKQPAWRANLRLLATEFAGRRGTNSSSTSDDAGNHSSGSQQHAL